jgi:hypothetical protein
VFDAMPFKPMIVDGMRITAFVCALFLAGCRNDLYEGSTADGEYWISATASSGINSASELLAKQASQLCPDGYHKLAQVSSGADGKLLRWRIHCGDSFGDVSVGQ